MTEAHLDNPGEIHWFKGERSLPILGLCPHANCKHLGQGVIAWGPTFARYELVECGVKGGEGCGSACRAWVDSQGRVVTPWMHVKITEGN